MSRTIRVLAVAIGAALLILVTVAGTASGSTEFTAAPARSIELASIGKLTFELEGTNVECNFTFNGRMRETAVRIAGGAIGEINEVRIRECVGAEIERVLIETPWSIVGTRALQDRRVLPENYTGLLLTIRPINWRFPFFIGIPRCLYQGDLGLLVALARSGAARYTTGNALALELSRFRQVGEAFGCPEEAIIRAEFRLTQQTLTFR